MSRPKSPERILLDQERAIRRERREQKRIERETKRAARELKAKAQESYDAKNGGDLEMKRSEFHPRLCCQGCGGFGIATKLLHGVGPVCPECEKNFDGRATPAEPGTTAVVQPDQLALFES
jgi:hypothetical protein